MEIGIEMHFMQNQQQISQYSNPSLQPEQSHLHQHPQQSPNYIQLLNEAREKLIDFISDLQMHRKTQIRGDIMQHCEQINRSRKVIGAYISDETIVRLVTSRIDKMVKNKKIKKNWSEDDVKVLVWVISKYCDRHQINNIEKDISCQDWQNISRLIPGVTPNHCMFKWLSMKKNNLSSFSWDPLQSQLLRQIIREKQSDINLVNKFTNFNWKLVAQQLYFRNGEESKVFRSAKQCRQHWNCFLNPTLKKGPWLLWEDIQLLSLIKNNNGQKKWSQIVHSFRGRTQNALKNRYTLLIDKQKRISKSKQEIALIEDCLDRCYSEQSSKNISDRVVINRIEVKNQGDSSDLKELSQNHKSDHLTVSSSQVSSPKGVAKSEMKIHYLTSSEQLQFLQLIRSRSDLKRCCLKNGSFEIEE